MTRQKSTSGLLLASFLMIFSSRLSNLSMANGSISWGVLFLLVLTKISQTTKQTYSQETENLSASVTMIAKTSPSKSPSSVATVHNLENEEISQFSKEEIIEILKTTYQEAIDLRIAHETQYDSQNIARIQDLEIKFHTLYEQHKAEIENFSNYPEIINWSKKIKILRYRTELENELKEISLYPIEEIIKILKITYEQAKNLQQTHQAQYDANNITEIQKLEIKFQEIYKQREAEIGKHLNRQEIIFWLTMITVFRHRVEKRQPMLSSLAQHESTQTLLDSAQKDELTPEARQKIVGEFRDALNIYWRQLEKIRYKKEVEKNSRYDDVYRKTKALYDDLDLKIIFFKEGGKLEEFVEGYQKAFANSKDEFQKNRSDPWFRRLVSGPIEQLKKAINAIALTYYQWRAGDVPLDPGVIERPFFKKSETSSTREANHLEKRFEGIVDANKPK